MATGVGRPILLFQPKQSEGSVSQVTLLLWISEWSTLGFIHPTPREVCLGKMKEQNFKYIS